MFLGYKKKKIIKNYRQILRPATLFGKWNLFKNAFYFNLKALFVLNIFKFLSCFLVSRKKASLER